MLGAENQRSLDNVVLLSTAGLNEWTMKVMYVACRLPRFGQVFRQQSGSKMSEI